MLIKATQPSLQQGIREEPVKLLEQNARQVVEEVRNKKYMPLEERSELRIRIGMLLSDSDAPALREIETDLLPLAPWARKLGERDMRLNLYEALID
jgi:hypothetical protein